MRRRGRTGGAADYPGLVPIVPRWRGSQNCNREQDSVGGAGTSFVEGIGVSCGQLTVVPLERAVDRQRRGECEPHDPISPAEVK